MPPAATDEEATVPVCTLFDEHKLAAALELVGQAVLEVNANELPIQSYTVTFDRVRPPPLVLLVLVTVPLGAI